MDDVGTLHARLDQKPEDWEARRELADLLEDDERYEEAFAQRWMAFHRHMPAKGGAIAGEALWYWGCHSKYTGRAVDKKCLLPDEVHALLKDDLPRLHWADLYWRYYRTREDAEASLAKALAAERSRECPSISET